MSRNLRFAKTILLVDDLEMLRKMVADFLESLGLQVVQASSAAEAIQIVLRSPGGIDLLLTDTEMPGMDGLELAKEVVALKPGIKIVYMSAGRTEEEWPETRRYRVVCSFCKSRFVWMS